MNEELQKKVDRAIRLIQSVKCDCIEVCYSGGKDSDVILELTKMAGVPYRAIYKNTTIDPPGTIAHCKSKGVEIMQPQMTFFKLIEKSGYPTRRARFCCSILKEYKVLDNSIQGIRKYESIKRRERYKEPIICRIYGKKENHVNVVLPVLDWSDNDIANFIQEREIKCHSLYYDENGKFRVERRLGCMACPMKSKQLQDFVDNPKLAKQWIKSCGKYWENRKSISKKFNNHYEEFVQDVFFDTYEDFRLATSGMFGKVDCKKFIENYFKIEL